MENSASKMNESSIAGVRMLPNASPKYYDSRDQIHVSDQHKISIQDSDPIIQTTKFEIKVNDRKMLTTMCTGPRIIEKFNSHYSTVKSQVPQNLIADANRREINARKLKNSKSVCQGLLNSSSALITGKYKRKMKLNDLNKLNQRFEYYSQKKSDKVNIQIAEKRFLEQKEIETQLSRNNVHKKYMTATPESQAAATRATARLFGHAEVMRKRLDQKRKEIEDNKEPFHRSL